MRPQQAPPDPSTRHDVNRREGGRVTAKRRRWHHAERSTAIETYRPLDELLDLDVSRVYLVGMPTAGDELRAWGQLAGETVEVYEDGHHPIVRVPAGGRARLVILAAETWWTSSTSADDAAFAWDWVEAAVQTAWRDPAVRLLNTPGTTGRDLWMRTPAADGCPVLDDELRTLIRSTASQGRIETMPARSELLPALHEYDMRLAYAAVMRRLPVGEPHECVDLDVIRRRPSRALVRFRPPDGWRHVGMIGVRATRRDDGIVYPTTPRWHGPTWADGCEVDLAVAHGWQVEVERGIVWDEGDPLRLWSERLAGVLDKARALDGARFAAVRAMVRAIMLHTVGAFVGAPHRVTVTGPLDQAPPGVEALRWDASTGLASWPATRAPAWPETAHPEWAAHVWARCRRRLLDGPNRTGVLNLDPTTLVAIRTDAVYTTVPTGWERHDDGKPGRWVHKGSVEGARPWPRTGLDVVAIREAAR